MERNRHPEYPIYQRDLERFSAIQNILETWKTGEDRLSAESWGQQSTWKSARELVQSLSAMFQAYNRILWESLPFCRDCQGQCCMRGGSYVAIFDLLALALLDQPFPVLPERIEAGTFDCIYRASSGCRWPPDWRTFKCWMFYCPGDSVLGRSGRGQDPHSQMARKLKPIFESGLPKPLQDYEQLSGMFLSANLEDPLASAEALGQALQELLITPLAGRYPEIGRLKNPPHYLATEPLSEPDFIMDASWEAFLAGIDLLLNASEALDERSGGGIPEIAELRGVNWLEDIEQLEWIALGRPADGAILLNRMYQRYTQGSQRMPDPTTVRQICQRIQHLLKMYDTPQVF